jgi:hypothetical protein
MDNSFSLEYKNMKHRLITAIGNHVHHHGVKKEISDVPVMLVDIDEIKYVSDSHAYDAFGYQWNLNAQSLERLIDISIKLEIK